jgi:Transposase
MEPETITWFAAVDWGAEKHQACVLDARGGIAGEREFSHSGAGLAQLCNWIISIAGSANVVAVAIETPHGPVVDVMLDRGFVVHAINPKQLDRLRDRFSVSGAKDDRRDAFVSADGYAPIDIFFAVCRSLIHVSSSCASGRRLPKSYSRNECG